MYISVGNTLLIIGSLIYIAGLLLTAGSLPMVLYCLYIPYKTEAVWKLAASIVVGICSFLWPVFWLYVLLRVLIKRF